MNANLLTWLLYDAGNSFLQTAKGGFYLAQWVVLDHGFADIWYGGTFTIATILVLVLSPLLGAWSDRIGKRLPFIKWLTFFMYLANVGLVLSVTSGLPAYVKVVSVLAFYLIVQVLYQLSLVSYNSLLEVLSKPTNRGKISGLGDAFNNAGWILGTAILLPFAEGKITLFGQPGRSQVFLPALIAFVLLTVPMLLWFKETKKVKKKMVTTKKIYSQTISGLKKLFTTNRNIGTFLLGFSFVSDAVLTIQLYFAIAMERIYGIHDRQKFGMLLIMLVTNVIGNYSLGVLSDKVGKKKVLIASCIFLVAVFLVGFSGSSVWILYGVAALAGIGWGGFYTTSRALMVSISPQDKLGEYFGLYSTFQRFASIIGPLVWGGVTLALSQYPIFKYRVAGFSLILLAVVGTMILKKVREDPLAMATAGKPKI